MILWKIEHNQIRSYSSWVTGIAVERVVVEVGCREKLGRVELVTAAASTGWEVIAMKIDVLID